MYSSPLVVTLVGGPTALLEIGGLRLLTDPTFDPPGEHPVGRRRLVKTRGPARSIAELGPIDAVLLSHDQHPDNLDDAGRRLLRRVTRVLTTGTAAGRLGGHVTAIETWRSIEVPRPGGGAVEVVGVPAQHGPDGTDHLTGPVTGFVLRGEGVPTVYVSGDNASLDVVRAVARRMAPIDVALLFAGAARTPLVDGHLTLTSDQAAVAARVLDADVVIPLHTEGWEHFTEGPDTIVEAFARRRVSPRLVLLPPGAQATVAEDAPSHWSASVR